ncbi:hypothetical protein HIM_05743 [Hirsutella minnesotensis 3608]|uniref:gamma-glutamylcyclotransferase n=1 Tax=Hirsutella minnesotensis 3608 TaxID=1043627 RepID=A0A0F8A574_9HYPO|nr:hypothetical protein HIM_05743 [Hirsutella minnesotensis 3608]
MAAPSKHATSASVRKPPVDPRLTKYYFAYGSNLHIKQMKKRCPNSRYIGYARLADYRWQINERGYANIVQSQGHWVDGLVYEIDDKDEAKLDINEGVAKNAYQKRHMLVLLHRAQSPLYRRPVSWIVDKGGPAAVCRHIGKPAPASGAPRQHWESDVLVYISVNHVQDSAPKDEYIHRINLGIADARALGIEDDYITNCIRPFIPEASAPGPHTVPRDVSRPSSVACGMKRSTPSRTGEPSPARKGQVTNRPDEQTPRRALVRMNHNASSEDVRGRGRVQQNTRHPAKISTKDMSAYSEASIFTVEEYLAAWEWRSSI